MNIFKRNQREFKKISIEQWHTDNDNNEDSIYWDTKYNKIKIPTRGTALSAGYDCFAPYTFTLEPNEEIKIPTGIRVIMNKNNYLCAVPRSGHGFKYYVRLANTIGIIDADYFLSDNEGHMWVKLRNEGDKTMTIKEGKGMCQLIFSEYQLVKDDTWWTGTKRNGGFGSTNLKED